MLALAVFVSRTNKSEQGKEGRCPQAKRNRGGYLAAGVVVVVVVAGVVVVVVVAVLGMPGL
jgi:hypothetical protein